MVAKSGLSAKKVEKMLCKKRILKICVKLLTAVMIPV